MIIQKAGNFEIFNQNDKLENISFNYSRTESDEAATSEKCFRTIKRFYSSFFDTKRTESTIKFGNGLLSLHCSSFDRNGNHNDS
jgi:hypothetical protein